MKRGILLGSLLGALGAVLLWELVARWDDR